MRRQKRHFQNNVKTQPTGVGVGLRPPHYSQIAENPTCTPWIEIVSENFFTYGRPMHFLQKIRREIPVAMHGVSLSITSVEFDRSLYLKQLKELINVLDPFVVSDHLCWTATNHHNTFDLLPFPYTRENLQVVKDNVSQVQEVLNRQLVLENISQYTQFHESEMDEADFLNELCSSTGCGILLDVNNVYVNSFNFKTPSELFLEKIKLEFVKQMHISGHTPIDDYLFDTHVGPVPNKVTELYQKALQKFHHIPVLLEWDADVPPLETLLQERERLEKMGTD